MGGGAYGLGGGEDGGEADGLLEEHVVAALHLLRGRKLLGKDLGSASLSLSLSGAMRSSLAPRKTSRGREGRRGKASEA